MVYVLSVNNNSSIFLDNTATHGGFSRGDVIGCAVKFIIKRLVLLTQKVALWGGEFVWPLPHFTEVGSLVMEGQELPQLGILLLLESIISCVQLGLARH